MVANRESLTLLHTNDLHGCLSAPKASFIAQLRQGSDLYFDSGDCIKAGNLAVPLRPDPAWPLLAEAGCDAGTIGNRESHILESAFLAKLEGHCHPLYCANLRRKDGSRPLPPCGTIEVRGWKVGIIGCMVAMVTERMTSKVTSAFLWDEPIAAVQLEAESLSDSVDLLIALTHIGVAQDRKLAEACPSLDLILGGHSHSELQVPERIGSTWICQGASHGKFIGRYRWEIGTGLSSAELISLPG